MSTMLNYLNNINTSINDLVKSNLGQTSTWNPQGIVVHYTYQKDTDQTPSIFELPPQFTFEKGIKVQDVLDNFPGKALHRHYHYRFLALCSKKDPSLKAWVDISRFDINAPVINKTIYMKILEVPHASSSKIYSKLAHPHPKETHHHQEHAEHENRHHNKAHAHDHGHSRTPPPQQPTKAQAPQPATTPQPQPVGFTKAQSTELNPPDLLGSFSGFGDFKQGTTARPAQQPQQRAPQPQSSPNLLGEDLIKPQPTQPQKPSPNKEPNLLGGFGEPQRPAQPKSNNNDLFNIHDGMQEDHSKKQFDPTFLTEKEKQMIEEKMKEKLEDQRKVWQREEAIREARDNAVTGVEPKILKWAKKGNIRNNIRTLLCSLQDVLWDGASWNPVSLMDLASDGDVRKVWMKAVREVHPDKNQSRTPEQIYIADRVFHELTEAYKESTSKK